MFIYANHMDGDIYFSNEEIDYDDLYCETCGDVDAFLGECSTREDALAILKEHNYDMEYINDKLDESFGNTNKDKYSFDDLFVGLTIKNINELDKIKNTLILLKKKKIGKKKYAYQVAYFGEYNMKNIIDTMEDLYGLIVVYNTSSPKFDFSKDVETNSHCVNKKIKANILPYEKMRKIGFNGKYYEGTKNEKDAPYFFINRSINFPLIDKYRDFDISFSIDIPKDGSDITINILDEDFCQPYDYQSMLSKNPNFEPCLIVFEQVEFWMKYLEYYGILDGHIYGEYI